MFQSIWEDIKQQIKNGNTVNRLIILNIAVFIIIGVFGALMKNTGSELLYGKIYDHLALPSTLISFIKKPWTLFTYMFMHRGIGHIFWNMLIYFWFGRIFGDLMGDRRVLPVYILTGIGGALFYFIYCGATGIQHANLVGASAAVTGTVLAAAATSPDYQINLILLGRISIKYIAAALIIIDILAFGGNSNLGGHIAHLGGAFLGWIYVIQLRNGVDLGSFIERFYTSFQDDKVKLKKKHRSQIVKKSSLTISHKREIDISTKSPVSQGNEERLNEILDKINQRGISSLTKEEKAFLDASSNIR